MYCFNYKLYWMQTHSHIFILHPFLFLCRIKNGKLQIIQHLQLFTIYIFLLSHVKFHFCYLCKFVPLATFLSTDSLLQRSPNDKKKMVGNWRRMCSALQWCYRIVLTTYIFKDITLDPIKTKKKEEKNGRETKHPNVCAYQINRYNK